MMEAAVVPIDSNTVVLETYFWEEPQVIIQLYVFC
jgi:hypothetical protein